MLVISLVGALLYALYATWQFTGDKLFNQYYYVVPIVVPFIAFLFDRAARFHQRKSLQLLVDALVVITAMWRVIGDVPYVSGHALFLTYVLLSNRSRIAFVTAAMVMIEVIYLKYFVWHDFITPTTGIMIGSLAALLSSRFNQKAVNLKD